MSSSMILHAQLSQYYHYTYTKNGHILGWRYLEILRSKIWNYINFLFILYVSKCLNFPIIHIVDKKNWDIFTQKITNEKISNIHKFFLVYTNVKIYKCSVFKTEHFPSNVYMFDIKGAIFCFIVTSTFLNSKTNVATNLNTLNLVNEFFSLFLIADSVF